MTSVKPWVNIRNVKHITGTHKRVNSSPRRKHTCENDPSHHILPGPSSSHSLGGISFSSQCLFQNTSQGAMNNSGGARASHDLLLRKINKNTAKMASQHFQDSGDQPEACSYLGSIHTQLAGPGKSRNSPGQCGRRAEWGRPAVPTVLAEQTSTATHNREDRLHGINSGNHTAQ